MPQCPNCSVNLKFADIHLMRPFACPVCKKELVVSDDYVKRLRWTLRLVALAICLILFVRNFYYLLYAPVVFGLVFIFGSIIYKRISLPPLEDVEGRSKEARYTAL